MKSKYFKIQELVPKAIYDKQGEEAWNLIDERLIKTLDFIREKLNVPLIVNNWSFGGSFQYRGFRPQDCTVGAKNSWHKKGLAVDFHSTVLSAEEIRRAIKRWQSELPYPIRLEENVSWVHLDMANKGTAKIESFWA